MATKKKATTTPNKNTKKGAKDAVTKRPKVSARKTPITPEGDTSAKRDEAARTAPAAPSRDPRLPEVGTTLVKRDRSGAARCECAVEADGIHYGGNVYKSLSAAAMAAASDLGIGGNQNGFVFWGLSKPPRANENPIARLQKAWSRYAASAQTALHDRQMGPPLRGPAVRHTVGPKRTIYRRLAERRPDASGGPTAPCFASCDGRAGGLRGQSTSGWWRLTRTIAAPRTTACPARRSPGDSGAIDPRSVRLCSG
jgi:hypothetical protein